MTVTVPWGSRALRALVTRDVSVKKEQQKLSLGKYVVVALSGRGCQRDPVLPGAVCPCCVRASKHPGVWGVQVTGEHGLVPGLRSRDASRLWLAWVARLGAAMLGIEYGAIQVETPHRVVLAREGVEQQGVGMQKALVPF